MSPLIIKDSQMFASYSDKKLKSKTANTTQKITKTLTTDKRKLS